MQTEFAIRQNFTMCNVHGAFSDIADDENRKKKYRFELCINVINRHKHRPLSVHENDEKFM